MIKNVHSFLGKCMSRCKCELNRLKEQRFYQAQFQLTCKGIDNNNNNTNNNNNNNKKKKKKKKTKKKIVFIMVFVFQLYFAFKVGTFIKFFLRWLQKCSSSHKLESSHSCKTLRQLPEIVARSTYWRVFALPRYTP